jgi:UDP-glucose 4-epimerase
MARYLVTGGAGFIGSHLVDSLVEEGHFVRVFDDLSSGRIENVPPRAELIVGDIADQEASRRALEDIDGCFHLAAIASVERCREEWLRSHTVNLGGTIAIFDAVCQAQKRRGQPTRVVYASSAAVYGDQCKIPVSEKATAHPTNAYGLDKLGCEMHAEIARRIHNLDSVGLRFFNVYGPRQDPNSPYSGVISIFCRCIAKGLPVQIYGDGAQLRDFVFVTDVVTAIRQAMDAGALRSHVFNVCTGTGTSIRRLGELIADINGVAFCAKYGPDRIGDIRRSVGNPRGAKELLDFTAEIPLRLGLTRTLSALIPASGGEVHAGDGLGGKVEA